MTEQQRTLLEQRMIDRAVKEMLARNPVWNSMDTNIRVYYESDEPVQLELPLERNLEI